MDRYVTGAVIRRLREGKKLTQEELAEKIHVSGKAVSKWETGQGFPDISLLEPLAKALGISVIELLSGLLRLIAEILSRRGETICRLLISLIKYLGGKQELGVSVANEIAAFLKCGFEVAQNDYKNGITCLIDLYNDKYPLDVKYRDLCIGLIQSV